MSILTCTGRRAVHVSDGATGDFRPGIDHAGAPHRAVVIATVEHHIFQCTLPSPAERDSPVAFILTGDHAEGTTNAR
jgi:hypothetical protein